MYPSHLKDLVVGYKPVIIRKLCINVGSRLNMCFLISGSAFLLWALYKDARGESYKANLSVLLSHTHMHWQFCTWMSCFLKPLSDR